MNENYKTIIIGAGLSGLTAANQLITNGMKKEDLLILEKAERELTHYCTSVTLFFK